MSFLGVPTEPSIWPDRRERWRWSLDHTPELVDLKKAAREAIAPSVVALLILRHLLAPASWVDEAKTVAASAIAGFLIIPGIRLVVNFWRAPRQIVEARHHKVRKEVHELRAKVEDILSTSRSPLDILVKIGGGPFIRPASKAGEVPVEASIIALQDVIITNRSPNRVSLSFELWLPWAHQPGAMLVISEDELSGVGRPEPAYIRGPLNLGPRESSACRDIGFFHRKGADEAFFGRPPEYDGARAVLRVTDMVSGKYYDAPVHRGSSALEIPESLR